MSLRKVSLFGDVLLAVAGGLDVALHNALTVVSIIGVLVAMACHFGTYLIHARNSEQAQARLKTKLFREWEQHRDADP